jgi:hypothetical protein
MWWAVAFPVVLVVAPVARRIVAMLVKGQGVVGGSPTLLDDTGSGRHRHLRT